MKVVISSYSFLPDIGGVATVQSVLASGFIRAGYDVTVVTTAPGPTTGYGYRVVRNPGPLELTRLYTEADILILANLSIKLFYPLLFLRRPFGLHHHSESAARLSHSWISVDLLRRSILHRAINFVASAYLGRKIGVMHHVLYPFANPEHITPAVKMPVKERRGAIFVGRIEEEKGILYLLDRWPAVREILGVDELRIVGDGALRPEIEAIIATGKAPGVRYVGRLSLAETAQEMGRAAYALVPSLWAEPFGTVALEALAAGAMVVLSNRGGMSEGTGDLGFVFDPDDEKDFESALVRARRLRESLLSSDEERANYDAAVARHIARFSPEVAIPEIVGVFERNSRGSE